MSSRDDDDASLTETRTATRAPESSDALAPRRNPGALVTVPVDHYEVGQERARGGLGKIVEAEDLRLGRTVAIKELIHVDEKSARRFIREARLTARLQHPSIVPVHEAGRWPTGEPFYTMKMISGRSLKEAMAEKRNLRERLSLLPNILAVAEAIAYAHSQKVIHRDLKPSNILVGEFGETVVVDWGLAKDLAEPTDAGPGEVFGPFRSVETNDLTAIGAVMGTPAYMPPEQARGENVDERADVYALGAILYHLLCGTSPFSGSSGEIISQLKESHPRRVLEVVPDAPADLVAIVERAMEREPERRYSHAGMLAEELLRFQTGQLVRAHEYGLRELAARWVKRHRAIALATLAFITVAIVGIVLFLSREQSLRRVAEVARDVSIRDRDRAMKQEARADTQTLALLEDRGREELRSVHPSRAAIYLARALSARPDNLAYRSLLTEANRALETIVWSAATARSDQPLAAFLNSSEDAVFLIFPDGSIRIVSTRTRALMASSRLDMRALCVDINAGRTAILVGSRDGKVLILDANTGSVVKTLSSGLKTIVVCHFSPNGKSIATSASDGTRVLDISTGLVEQWIPNSGDTTFAPPVAFNSGGDLLVACGEKNSLEVVDLRTHRRLSVLRGHSSYITSVSFSADGRSVLTASDDTTARLWDARTGRSVRILAGHDRSIRSAKFSADDKQVLTTELGGIVRIWELPTGKSTTLDHGANLVTRAFFVNDENLVMTVTNSGELRLFSRSGDVLFGIDLPSTVIITQDVVLSADQRTVFVVGADGRVSCVNLPLDSIKIVGRVNSYIYRLVYRSRLGDEILVGDDQGEVSIARSGVGLVPAFRAHEGVIWRIVVSQENGMIITIPVYPDIKPKLWSPSGSLVAELVGHGAFVYDGAFQPHGPLIATAARDGEVRFWDSTTGVASGQPLANAGQAIAFSPDGTRLATAGAKIRIWDVKARQQIVEFDAHPNTSTDTLRFDPRGQLLLSAGWDDHLAKIWNASTGELLVQLEGHTSRLMAAEFSPDGKMVATAAFDHTARLWDARTGELLRTIPGVIHALAFSPDGRTLATGIGDTVVLWDITLDPRSPEELAAYAEEKSPWKLVDGRLVRKSDTPVVTKPPATPATPPPPPPPSLPAADHR
jgi:WD40 repeat protein